MSTDKYNQQKHPLDLFHYCPKCGSDQFYIKNEKAKCCHKCGFVYYFNPSAAVACFIHDSTGQLLLVRRGKEPAKGTLDLPGGFVDMNETAEEAARREVKEETGLELDSCKLLFSIPNRYPYSGFLVHTIDLFFTCEVKSFDQAKAADDAAELIITNEKDLRIEDFGLLSIKQAIARIINAPIQ